jgi:hypothetical protein
MRVFAEVRKARVVTPTPSGPRYHLPTDYLKGLDYATRKAIEGVGGGHVIAAAEDERLPILRPQFADMWLSAVQEAVRVADGCSTDHEPAPHPEADGAYDVT